MKKYTLAASLFTVIWLTGCPAHSQPVPQGINYQAVARNESGNLLVDQPVAIKIALLDSTATGTVLYEEIHSLTTNAFGLFNLVIGQGDSLIGDFDTISWGLGAKFIKISVDQTGGNDFIDMGTTQLLSVPYALYAAKSGETENTPSLWRQQGSEGLAYPGDASIGGNTDLFDGPAETMALLGRSKAWYIGVENKEDEFGNDSGFFISQSSSSDGTFHIFENGMVMVPKLHVKQGSFIIQNEDIDRGWLLGIRNNGKLLFSEGTFSDAGSSLTTARLAITQDGKLGIGNFNIDNPTHELHLIHASTGGGGATAGLKIENEGNAHNWWSFYTTNSSGELELYYKGTIRGEFDPADGEYRQRSDRRLKTSVAPLPPTLEKILQLRPSTYYFKDDENPVTPSLGFIAQEVQPLFPELTGLAGEDQSVMTLNYDGFSVLAIKAIQEQQVLIEQLQQRIEMLEEQILRR